ncbi:hypothetical protein GCM10023238_29510 [Streptomyces heliomycini]
MRKHVTARPAHRRPESSLCPGVRTPTRTGRGTFKIRATVTVEERDGPPQGTSSRSCPSQVGPEQVVGKIKDLVGSKTAPGIADVKDLT